MLAAAALALDPRNEETKGSVPAVVGCGRWGGATCWDVGKALPWSLSCGWWSAQGRRCLPGLA